MLSQPILVAVFVGLTSFLLLFWWFGIVKRRQAEIVTGVTTLATMKWRECVGLVIQSLEKEGYREERASRQPGDGGTEFLLKKGEALTLLSYKHGTAYHLGEANVRDFANGVQLIGANKGILVTLGTVDGMAKDSAGRYDIELIDGKALWPRVENYLSAETLATVRQQAGAQTKSKVEIAVVLSLILAALGYFAGITLIPASEPQPADVAKSRQPNVATLPSGKTEDATLAKINATAIAMAEVDKLTDQQRAERKAKAAAAVSEMPIVKTAIWYSASTLQVMLNTEKNDDKSMVSEICRILTQYEELRFTRLQLEPPTDSAVPVRFRQCQ